MRRIAIIVSTVGYHWEELFDAYWVFHDAGAELALFTVNGQSPRVDPMSVRPTGPASWIGLGLPASIAPGTQRGLILSAKLKDSVLDLQKLDPLAFDAIYLPGGHGCLFDVNRDPLLHSILGQMHEKGRLLAAVCHATSTFAFVKHAGRSIIAGHAVTGFPHPMDQALIAAGLVHSKFLPLPLINDEELKKAKAKHSVLDQTLALINPRHMHVSLPFITGVGPKSAAPVAKALIKALHKIPPMAERAHSEVSGKRA